MAVLLMQIVREGQSPPFDFAQGRPFGSAQDGERKSNREPIERRRRRVVPRGGIG